MPVRAVLPVLVLAALALLPPSPAAADTAVADPDPIATLVGPGPHRFVALVTRHGRRVMAVTAATRKRYAGHMIDYRCSELPTSDSLASLGGSGGGAASVGDRSERYLTTDGDADYCQVQITERTVRRGRSHGRKTKETRTVRMRQTVAITPAGRDYVTRVRAAMALQVGLLTVVSAAPDPWQASTLPTAADVVAKHPIPRLVALADATTAPAPGQLGIWTDGAQRLRVAYGLPDGTALFYERDVRTRVVTTNAEEEIADTGRDDGWWADSSSRSSRG